MKTNNKKIGSLTCQNAMILGYIMRFNKCYLPLSEITEDKFCLIMGGKLATIMII